MKNFLFLFAIILSCISQENAIAQQLSITDALIVHNDKERACVQVILAPDAKTVKGKIEDWMKDKHDVKLKGFGFMTNKEVLSTEEVSLPAISSNKLDFFVQVVEEESHSKMCVFASVGYSIHISKEEYPLEYQVLKSMTLDFLSDFLPDWYQARIEEAQEVSQNLEKDRSSLKNDIDKNMEAIKKLEAENVNKNKELKEKMVAINGAAETLEESKKKLIEVNKILDQSKAEMEVVN